MLHKEHLESIKMKLWQSLHQNDQDLDSEELNIKIVKNGLECIISTTLGLSQEAHKKIEFDNLLSTCFTKGVSESEC